MLQKFRHLLFCQCFLSTLLCQLAARAMPKRLTKQRKRSILRSLATPSLSRKEVVDGFTFGKAT